MQLEKRVSWRRALKKALKAAVLGGVKGIKVQVAGPIRWGKKLQEQSGILKKVYLFTH